MESAAEATVHEFAAFGPEWLMAFGILLLLVALCIAFIPLLRDVIKKRLELDEKDRQAKNALEAEREKRKSEEQQSREQRDRERSAMEGQWASQNERAIAAQEKGNVVMESMKSQLEVMNAQLIDSKANSKNIGEDIASIHHKIEEVDRKVDAVHHELMR